MAAIAGALLCSSYPTLQPTTGSMAGHQGLHRGGVRRHRSIPGAMLGGILLGVIEILGRAYNTRSSVDAFVFAVLIVVLLVKPTVFWQEGQRESVR